MEELIHAIQPHATARFIKKHTVLFYQGEIPRQAQIIRRGLVKVYSITATGEERIVSLHSDGDIFPLPWVFGETSNTLFYHETVVDSEIISIPKSKLMSTLVSDPLLLGGVFKFVVNEYTSLLLHITALEQARAVEKIGFALYYLMFHYGREIRPGIFVINLKLTHPMIASLIGLTRESVVINLKLLKRKNIIHSQRFTYEVDKALLEKFLREDSFKDLSLR